MKRLLPLVLLSVVVVGAWSAVVMAQTAVARGVVFEDVNGDGVRQANEPGVGGVAVSDGDRVVQTDAAGRYELRIDAEDAIVFVVKPAGYQVAMDHLNLQRGYYIHKPAGSPDEGFQFEGVDPTGLLPASIDFPLTRIEESETFTAIAFGDPQPYNLEEIALFRREVVDPLTDEHGNTVGASLGISLGDLVGDNLHLFEPLNEAQALFGVPWYNVLGNHDMNFMSGGTEATAGDPDRYSDETYERVYGPLTYAFQVGRVHFIILDNVKYKGFSGYQEGENPDWLPGLRTPKTGNYEGHFRSDQLRFIENYLGFVPREDLVVLAFHIPIGFRDGEPGIAETPRLLRILSGHPNTLSISGHTHFQRHWLMGEEEGYRPSEEVSALNQHVLHDPERFARAPHHHGNLVTVSGSWYRGEPDEEGVPHATMRDGAPNGYTLLHFDGNRYRTEFRAARRAAHHQMTLAVGAGEGGERVLTANVFNGAEGDRVEARVLAGAGIEATPIGWWVMDYSAEPDPMYEALSKRENERPDRFRGGRASPGARVSWHLWKTELPAGLPAGTHVVEVRHTDLYGHVHVDRFSFRVE
ncbi:calcineurin-like phosphoesterase C-terminal domain-containing protein [Mucisphaera sp.]|uniref:calcineurin-like phosphoesterase C-terminal domain-containing protein n=1 Tax=Mucisphaera sp. TaxID=2913024 RepID=UPI003D0FCE19